MSVNVEWKTGEEGHSGIVAEGTYLWDAAKRLGVRLPAECAGRGECDTCAVIIEEGAALLSELTDAERSHLGPQRLATAERLACQARVERAGTIVLRPVPVTERAETTEESVRDFRKDFAELPLQRKIATLVDLEAMTAYQTLVKVVNLPFAAIEKGLDLMAGRGRTLSERARAARRPSEHHPDAESKAAGE